MSGELENEPVVVVAIHRPSLRERVAAELERRLLEAVAVDAAREVVAELERRDVAAMVIDASLPMTSGYELATAIRRHQLGGEVALVLITELSWSPAQKALAIQDLDLLDVLSDPIDPEQIADLLAAELLQEPDPGEPLADQASRSEARQVEQAAEGVHGEHDELEIKGSLIQIPFPKLLHDLYRKRASGALFLLKDNIKKIVYFLDGHPTYVKSNLLSECLGNVLVRERMISEEDCERSLLEMRDTRRQQGTVLIENGVISPQNLVVALELQLQAKLFDIFSWRSGQFLFKADAVAPSDVIRLDMSNAGMIAEGVRRHWTLERVEGELEGSMDLHPVPASDPELQFQHLPLDDMEQALRDAFDGSRTLRQQVALSPLPDERALAVAYILVVSGVVELVEGPTQAPEDSSEEEEIEEARVRERLAQELLSLRSGDAFGVLRVSASATDREVEQAYSSLARSYHPDRYRSYASETRQLARELFGLVHEAYKEIASAERRRNYARGREQEEMLSDAGRTLKAEERAQRAQALVDAGDWSGAYEELTAAVELCEDAGDLRALLGWVTYQLDPESQSRIREAIRQLRHATKLAPRHYLSYLYLGRIYARIGRSILAEKQFERAVQCNPDCTEALEQLSEHEERRRSRRMTQRLKP